jgi:hypothetical protein
MRPERPDLDTNSGRSEGNENRHERPEPNQDTPTPSQPAKPRPEGLNWED